MGSGAVMNYQGVADAGLEVIEGPNGEKFLGVYNDSGGAHTDGDNFFLSFLTDVDSQSQWPTLDAMATSAIYRLIVAVIPKSGLSGIADTAYGFVQSRGDMNNGVGVLTTGGMTDENFLQGTNASQALSDDGTSITIDTAAVVKGAAVSNITPCVFMGGRVNIG